MPVGSNYRERNFKKSRHVLKLTQAIYSMTDIIQSYSVRHNGSNVYYKVQTTIIIFLLNIKKLLDAINEHCFPSNPSILSREIYIYFKLHNAGAENIQIEFTRGDIVGNAICE